MTHDMPTEPQPPALAATRVVHKITQPGDTIPVVLDQPFSHDSLYQLRAAVAAHVTRAGVPTQRTQDVVLAVNELAANVIRHGSGHGRVRIWVNEHSLHCQVTDAGPSCPTGTTADLGADPASTPPPPWPIEPEHGLWIVCRLADQTSFNADPPSTAAFSIHFEPADTDQGTAKPEANRDAILNHERESQSSQDL